MLTLQQAELLKRMQDDSYKAGPPFCAKDHWERVHVEFNRAFALDGIQDNVEDQSFNNHFSSWSPSFTAYYTYACNLFYNILRERDKWGVLGKVKSMLPEGSPRRFMLYGQPLSWDVLISLNSLLVIAGVSSDILTTSCVVGEIGGGWGRLGYVLRQVNPAATYMDFDLPETMLIAQTYLPKIVPTDQKFVLYDESHQTDFSNGILRNGSIWFCGAHEMARLPHHSLDYVISIASFQEMPRDYLDLYFNLIHQVGKILYIQQEHGNGTNGGYFPFKPEWEELLKHDSIWREQSFDAIFRLG